MATATYGSISQRTTTYAEAKMLDIAENQIAIGKFADQKPVPRNRADNVKFRKVDVYSVATTALTEGVTPTPHAPTYTDVTATLLEYGDIIQITNKIADLSEDPVLNDAIDASAEQAALTRETLTYNVAKAGTAVAYSGGSSRVTVDERFNLGEHRNAVQNLMSQKGKKLTKMQGPSAKFNTVPIPACFVAFAHTDLLPDLEDVPGWTPIEKYAAGKIISPFEEGKIGNTRFILTAEFSPFLAGGASIGSTGLVSAASVNIDVYPVIYFAAHCLGTVALKGKSAVEMSIISPGQKTKDDVLGQRGYVGWHMWHVDVRLNENWMYRVEVGVTDQ